MVQLKDNFLFFKAFTLNYIQHCTSSETLHTSYRMILGVLTKFLKCFIIIRFTPTYSILKTGQCLYAWFIITALLKFGCTFKGAHLHESFQVLKWCCDDTCMVTEEC